MEINTVTNEIIKMVNERMEQIIKQKLSQILTLALRKGEMDLAEIAYHFYFENINGNILEEFKNHLEKYGYSIELEQLPNKTNYDTTDGVFRATAHIGEVKLKIKKLILEI